MPSGATYKVTNAIAKRLAVQPQILEIATQIAADARASTPVTTGRLAGGWHTAPGRDPGTTLVVNDVEYARYVEYGTRRRRAVAMLGRALASRRGGFG
jgi:hypothetical protein